MKTYITIIISVVALAVGFMAGKLQASGSWSNIYKQGYYGNNGANVRLASMALLFLRSGDKDSCERYLENSLDVALFSLAPMPVKLRTQDIQAAINQAQTYRTKYPWQGTSPQMEASVEKVLGSAMQ
jgi:hypothetical protein